MNKNKFLPYIILSISFLFSPVILFAQPSPDLSYVTDLLTQFGAFLNTLVFIIMALSIVFFLWGMMIFILNAGNEEKRSEGKKRMVWGILVLVVMVSIWGIVNLLASVFIGGGNGDFIDCSDYACPLDPCPPECRGGIIQT